MIRGKKHPNELAIPLTALSDDDAVEMLRIWIADGSIRVTPNLGVWADADVEVDEAEAWGQLLSDTIKHIARGLYLSHGMNKVETTMRLREALLWNLSSEKGAIDGKFTRD